MHLTLFGIYMFDGMKGFYLGKIGDISMDSSLLGVHWETEVDEDEGIMYSSLSFDILWLSLARSTYASFMGKFKKKDNKIDDTEED